MAEAREDAKKAAGDLEKQLEAEYSSKIDSKDTNEAYSKILDAQSEKVHSRILPPSFCFQNGRFRFANS
jgi:hypothetical protein